MADASSGPSSGAGTTAILVNWNCTEDTATATEHLLSRYPHLAVVVVDNASEPAERESLRVRLGGLPAVRLVWRPDNGGYAAGVNAGFRSAKASGARWAWLINPDARPHAGALEALLGAAAGSVGLSPQQRSSPEFGVDEVPYVSAATSDRGHVTQVSCSASTGTHDVDVISGTGLLFDVQAAYGVGLMDESFFHYKEEFEFSERMAVLGRLQLVCAAGLWHRRGGSLDIHSPAAAYYHARNEILYLRRRGYSPASRRLWVFVVRAALEPVRAKNPTRLRFVLRAVRDGLLGRGGQLSGPRGGSHAAAVR